MEIITSPAVKERFNGIDLIRGIIMVIMALDHVRDFFYHIKFSPTDLAQTTASLFFDSMDY